MNPDVDAVVGQIGLQALGAAGLSRPLVRRLDLDFQPCIRLRSRLRRAFVPGVLAAFRYIEQPAHRRHGVSPSQFVYPPVFHRDSFAKHVANFFSRSRSILASAGSLRVRANSSSSSLGSRYPFPTSASLPSRAARTQLSRLLFGIDSCFAAFPTDIPVASTNLTASAGNSGV